MLSKKKASRKARFFFAPLAMNDSHWDRYLGMTAASARFFVFKR